ncbi:MAG: recombinase family protein [Desulfovibrio sp.]|nr:recombinase family protein [Desulfovibrio sp.]
MQHVYGYIRVSGKGQVDGDGFERQKQAIEACASAAGLHVVNYFQEEGVSGTKEDRPALARMLVDMEENGHGVKTVIVERLDRLARDLMVQEVILSDFQRLGVSFVSAVEGSDLLEGDATRKLVRQVLGAIAEYDKAMLVSKLRAARERKRARTGKCEGRKGYADTEEGRAIIREVKRLRRKKPGCKAIGYERIAAQLNGEGRTTLDGKAFTGATVQRLVSTRSKG